MRYSIERICWCESTYNGFTDNPYWKIRFEGSNGIYGLDDSGHIWSINGFTVTNLIKEKAQTIITECKLNITLN